MNCQNIEYLKFSFLRFTVLRYNIRYRFSLPFSTSRNRNRLSRYVIHSCISFSVKAVDLFWNFKHNICIHVRNVYFLPYTVRKIIFSSKEFENLSKIVNCDWQLRIRYVDRSNLEMVSWSKDGVRNGWTRCRLATRFQKLQLKSKLTRGNVSTKWIPVVVTNRKKVCEHLLKWCWQRTGNVSSGS